jgi:hypothetical protein
MSQNFKSTPPTLSTNIFQDNVDQINNDNTLRSCFSGTAFPTSPEPVYGQLCYRTDQGVLYVYRWNGWQQLAFIEDQIVNGVTDKAPSQNAVYDALASKTDKSTLTTKGDLYVRDATGITRLPIGSDDQVLTADSGQTSGVKWASPAGGGGMKYQIFTSSGTFTVPSGITKVYVTMVGGGGGGGGGSASDTGQGGGSGGAYFKTAVSVTPGSDITVTIGAGGAGGAWLYSGSTGETTSFGSYLSATGGKGGGGSIGVSGDAGLQGSPANKTLGADGSRDNGKGGDTIFGLGGVTTSRNATGYGSGGGGSAQDSDLSGGAGSPGYCLIEW